MTKERSYEDVNYSLVLQDGIMVGEIKEGVVINKDVSAIMIRERLRLSEGKSYPVILDGRKAKYWTMSSRNNYMKELSYDLITAAAVILSSPIMKVIWNYTTKLFPPPVPLKVFPERESAIEWLQKYKNA